jgi:hypothetical protein
MKSQAHAGVITCLPVLRQQETCGVPRLVAETKRHLTGTVQSLRERFEITTCAACGYAAYNNWPKFHALVGPVP